MLMPRGAPNIEMKSREKGATLTNSQSPESVQSAKPRATTLGRCTGIDDYNWQISKLYMVPDHDSED